MSYLLFTDDWLKGGIIKKKNESKRSRRTNNRKTGAREEASKDTTDAKQWKQALCKVG